MTKVNRRLLIIRRVNLAVMISLFLVILSTFAITYEDGWKFLPVFKFHIPASDQKIEIFVHAFLFAFNLGFYIQLFTLIFSFLIYFSTQRTISFHMMYSLVIIRSILIIIQSSTLPQNYISAPGDFSVIGIQIFYIAFFLLLFILNQISDPKKKPHPDSYRDGANH